MPNKSIAIIGAGAAGCFCAIRLRERYPDADICIYEAGRRPLAKLARTGGGRCNLTNTFAGAAALDDGPGPSASGRLRGLNGNLREFGSLASIYPRGERLMKRALQHFGPQDTVDWFEAAGVRLYAQADQRVFPCSDDAMQVVRALEARLRSGRVGLLTQKRLCRIAAGAELSSAATGASEPNPAEGLLSSGDRGTNGSARELLSQKKFSLFFADGSSVEADAVVLALGGCSSSALEAMLPPGIELAASVPSLFTFRAGNGRLRSLMGTCVENVALSIRGTQFCSQGTLLITDWGLSGPAVLRLSSYAARHLAECGYKAFLTLNWTGLSIDELREWMDDCRSGAGSKRCLGNLRPPGISERLWKYLLERAVLSSDLRWAELSNKAATRLSCVLAYDSYEITGRAAFREEFVTCGGVDLSAVNLSRLESKMYPGLFFAGEVLDVDAVTGGYNLQAAWSTAAVVASAL